MEDNTLKPQLPLVLAKAHSAMRDAGYLIT